MNLSNNRINTNHHPQRNSSIARGNTKAIANLADYGTPSRPVGSLTEGEILKGEVTDLRNNSIIVTLEDNTCVAAQLKNGSWLSIGQTAAFRVVSLSANGVVLEPLPSNNSALETSTILKALEEALLPKTDKNKLIVHELMKNNLPINKQSILAILQQTYQYKEASISALIFMNKHQIPITEQNAIWLENYQNHNHQLLYQIEDLSANLPQMLDTLSKEVPKAPFSNILQKLLTTLTEQAASTPHNDLPLPLSNAEELNDLVSILENFQMDEIEKESILNGSATLRQVMNLINRNLLVAIEADTKVLNENNIHATITMENDGTLRILNQSFVLLNSDSAFVKDTVPEDNKSGFSFLENLFSQKKDNSQVESSIAIENKDLSAEKTPLDLYINDSLLDPVTNKPLDILLRVQTFSQPVIKKLYESFLKLQTECNEIGSNLTLNQRSELYHCLSDFPLNPNLKENVLSGEISSTELFSLLKNVLNFTPPEKVSNLLQNTTFQSMLESKIIQHMTLTPKELQQKNSVEAFFDEINHRFGQWKELLDEVSTSSNLDAAKRLLAHSIIQPEQQSIEHMQDNLQFMKALNQMFTYIQLPLKLQNQNVHGELYVYTKKKERLTNPKEISVLLHLDLTHLGALDIQIQLKGQQIHSSFFMDDENTLKLLKVNVSILETRLLEKGYLFTSEFQVKETPLGQLEHFLQPNSEHNTNQKVNRYSFDIRV